MALPPEVVKTIAGIDKKIKEMERVKAALVATFGGNSATDASPPKPPPKQYSLDPTPATSSGAKLLKFLNEAGPSTRREIIEKAGIPEGSVSYVLNREKDRGTIIYIEETEQWMPTGN